MVDLDSGTHYDLFKVYHPQDRESPSSFQLSFKEGVRSNFWVALCKPSCWKGGNNFGLVASQLSICYRNITHLHLSS